MSATIDVYDIQNDRTENKIKTEKIVAILYSSIICKTGVSIPMNFISHHNISSDRCIYLYRGHWQETWGEWSGNFLRLFFNRKS